MERERKGVLLITTLESRYKLGQSWTNCNILPLYIQGTEYGLKHRTPDPEYVFFPVHWIWPFSLVEMMKFLWKTLFSLS